MNQPASSRSIFAIARSQAWLALVPLLVIVAAIWLSHYRGPFWLHENMDPEYAYLCNSLLVAQGYYPGHTDHPGTPLQVLGAAVLHTTHALSGSDVPLRDDVLLRPEFYLNATWVVLLALVAAGNVLLGYGALRLTSRRIIAAAAQLSPFLSTSALIALFRVTPEPLVLAAGSAVAGTTMLALARPAGSRQGPWPALLGVLMGIGMSAKIPFAVVAVLPFLVLRGLKGRAIFLTAMLASFLVCTIPMWPRRAVAFGFLRSCLTRSGSYGGGEKPFADWSRYPIGLKQLLLGEILLHIAVVLAAVIAAGTLLRWRFQIRPQQWRLCLAIAAVLAIDAAMVLVFAKNPQVRYLTPAGSLLGLVVVSIYLLTGGAGRTQPPHRLPWLTGGVAWLAVLVLAGLAWQWPRAKGIVDGMEKSRDASLAAGALRGQIPHLVQGWHTSTVPSALLFGSSHARNVLVEDLRRLYPDEIFMGSWGLHHFGIPLPEHEPMIRGGGPPRDAYTLLASWWLPLERTTLKEQWVATPGESFIYERLYRTMPRPVLATAGSEQDPFAGILVVSGLGNIENSRMGRVRWAMGREAQIQFLAQGDRMWLQMECRRNNDPRQQMTVLLNGEEIHVCGFDATHEFHELLLPISPRPGMNQLTLGFRSVTDTGTRQLAVLFRKLRVLPAEEP